MRRRRRDIVDWRRERLAWWIRCNCPRLLGRVAAWLEAKGDRQVSEDLDQATRSLKAFYEECERRYRTQT